MFKGKKGKQFAAEIGKRAKTFVPGAALPEKRPASGGAGPMQTQARQQDVAAIRVSYLCRPCFIKLPLSYCKYRYRYLDRSIFISGSNS